MDFGGRQPWEGAKELVAVISYSEPGGGISEGVGKFLQGGGPGGVSVRGGDVVPHPEDGAGPGQFSTQGCKEDHREVAVKPDGSWEYPPLTEALGKAGFEGIRKLVTRRQNMVAQYIATRTIPDLCKRATQRPGARLSCQWW